MKASLQKWLQIAIGCFVTAGGVIILKHSAVVTGGTAGLSLSISPMLDIPFHFMFALLNLPFFIFSFYSMGKAFTIRTIISIAILTSLTSLDALLPDFSIPTWIGTIVGGAFIGVGLIGLFRNGASLGGVTIICVYLHKKYGINPGKSNFVFDFIVIVMSLVTYSLVSGVYSVLSIAVTSAILAAYKKNKLKPASSAQANISAVTAN
ncbi:YitT family protein [Paenibacillus sp. M.A.Huq-81]